jgi:excisionase family DNA binding protein
VTVAPSVPVVDRFLLDEPEIAELCGVSRNTVREWVASGLLESVELPRARGTGRRKRRVLYRRDDVLAFVASLPSAGARAAS